MIKEEIYLRAKIGFKNALKSVFKVELTHGKVDNIVNGKAGMQLVLSAKPTYLTVAQLEGVPLVLVIRLKLGIYLILMQQEGIYFLTLIVSLH
jgi:hypothetical protein